MGNLNKYKKYLIFCLFLFVKFVFILFLLNNLLDIFLNMICSFFIVFLLIRNLMSFLLYFYRFELVCSFVDFKKKFVILDHLYIFASFQHALIFNVKTTFAIKVAITLHDVSTFIFLSIWFKIYFLLNLIQSQPHLAILTFFSIAIFFFQLIFGRHLKQQFLSFSNFKLLIFRAIDFFFVSLILFTFLSTLYIVFTFIFLSIRKNYDIYQNS